MTDIRVLSTDELRQRLEHDRQGLEFWNALTDDYFSGEMIPGSRRVPVDSVGHEVAKTGIAKDTEIIVYCSGPTCPQSRAAAEKLTKLGYTNVRLYEGGLAEWKAAGLAIDKPFSAEPRAA